MWIRCVICHVVCVDRQSVPFLFYECDTSMWRRLVDLENGNDWQCSQLPTTKHVPYFGEKKWLSTCINSIESTMIVPNWFFHVSLYPVIFIFLWEDGKKEAFLVMSHWDVNKQRPLQAKRTTTLDHQNQWAPDLHYPNIRWDINQPFNSFTLVFPSKSN